MPVRALFALLVLFAIVAPTPAPVLAARPLCGQDLPVAEVVIGVDDAALFAVLDGGEATAVERMWQEVLGRTIVTRGDVEPLWNANLYAYYTTEDLALTHGSSDRNRFYLHEFAAQAFTRMRLAAEAEGFRLRVGSAWRSWRRQLRAYENFKKTGTNLNGTPVPNIAHPCDSKHPAALAVDMDVRERSALYRWLVENAASYGFKNTRADEPWEWQFVGIEESVEPVVDSS